MSKYQIFPNLTDEEYQELKSDIAARGVQVPIEVDENKAVLDGHHRMRACQELGIKNYPVVVRIGMTEEQKQLHIRKLNLARRHLNQEQKRAVIAAQLKATPELSDRTIAKELGVHHTTVGTVRDELENKEQVAKLATSTGLDGKLYPRDVKPIPKPSSIFTTPERVEKVIHDAENRPHVSFNSGENEWYTPKEYIEAAVRVMGTIDLDPASNPVANEVVRASTFYSKDDNGLSKKWMGRVFMNPPYASDLIKQFTSKFAFHVSEGHISQGVVLVNNATETEWFGELISCATAVVFPKGRIKFVDMDGKASGAPLQGQAFIYFGENDASFLEEFGAFGWGAVL